MKLSYEILKRLILEQAESERNLDIEKLRELSYLQDLPQEEVENLIRILAHYTDDEIIQDYGENLYKKAIYQHFRTEEDLDGAYREEAYRDEPSVDYYHMDNYLGNIYLGAVEIRSHQYDTSDPIIDANVIGGHSHFLGMPGFALYRESGESDERNLNRYLQDGNYDMYTYERIREYLLTPDGKDLLLYYINNKT